MKTLYKIAAILVVAFSYSCLSQRPILAQPGYVSFQVFYDQLSPYGQWIDYPNYGYVWIPNAGRTFVPYSTNGYWVMTEYGWTWISKYRWGWAPFHYGRWDFDDYIGWFWIPGNEWGPAWVTWRSANGYYGWTPLRPGISISLSFSGGYGDIDHWCFVRDRDFGRRDIYRYYVGRQVYEPIIRNSIVINNTYLDNRRNVTYIAGPRRDDVQRITGRRINSMGIRDDVRPGETLKNNQLQIYRPQVERIGSTDRKPVPSRISNLNEVRSMRGKNAEPQRNVIVPSDNNKRTEQQGRQQPQQAQPQQQMRNQRQQPQQRVQQPGSQQQRTAAQRQQVEQQKSQQIEKRQQLQPQQKQALGQQKREQKRAERTQKRIEQKKQKKADTPSDNNKQSGRKE
jgi:hypothetical protein